MATSSAGAEAEMIAALVSQVPITYGALLLGSFLGFM